VALHLKQIKHKDGCTDANGLLASSIPPSDLIRLHTTASHVVYFVCVSISGCAPTNCFTFLYEEIHSALYYLHNGIVTSLKK